MNECAQREPPAPAAAADPTTLLSDTRADHAPVLVLSNRSLWELITGFMIGYPFVVHKFIKEHRATVLRRDKRVGFLGGDGVLLHLAIAADTLAMLKRLYKLGRLDPADRKLSSQQLMGCAVLYDRVNVLEFLVSERESDLLCQYWEPHLVRLAVHCVDSDLRVLEWLYNQFPRHPSLFQPKDLMFHTQRGDLRVVQWLCEHMPSITQDVVDETVRRGHLDLLSYFYEHGPKRCSRLALEAAAFKGHVDVVKLVINNQKDEMRRCAINAAAKNGHLEIVKFILEGATENELWPSRGGGEHTLPASEFLEIVKYQHKHHHSGWAYRVMQYAALQGHMEAVTYLQTKLQGRGCPTAAIDWAAVNGHVEIMKYLHSLDANAHAVYRVNGRPDFIACVYTDCSERCSGTEAMDTAASSGHLEVVKFLHNFTARGCTAYAMNWAALKGYIRVVQSLMNNRSAEVCAASALSMAASAYWNTAVVRFLADHCSGDEILLVLIVAAVTGYRYIVQILYELLQSKVIQPKVLQSKMSVYGALEAAVLRGQTIIAKFLFQKQACEPMSFMKQAMAKSSTAVMVYLLASTTNLSVSIQEFHDGQAFALELNEFYIPGLLLAHIEVRVESEASEPT